LSSAKEYKVEFTSSTEAKWSEAMLSSHNLPRQRVGLPAFQWNNALAAVAREWLRSDSMLLQCSSSSSVVHSSKEFRTQHPVSPFYYLGETAASKELPAGADSTDAIQLAQEAVGRWSKQTVRYGRWGSACTVEDIEVPTALEEDQKLEMALAAAEGFLQSLWERHARLDARLLFVWNMPTRRPTMKLRRMKLRRPFFLFVSMDQEAT